ncbi:MAG: hypothetical protein E2O39_03490 [Planctomycetota bacterium]|nr:MAG: hypothetical protein E2O39_03490 [Planctomycetota bacterium]
MTASARDVRPAQRPPNTLRALLVLIAIATGLKLCLILAPPVDIQAGGHGMEEELMRGTAAQEFLDGPLLPFMDYQVNGFSGGSLVVSVLAVPLFATFGAKLFVLRLVTLLFGALGVASVFLVLDRWVSRRAAWVGGLLLAIPPPGYSIVSTTAWGTHLENNALTLFVLFLWLRVHSDGRRGFLAQLALGIAAGFATYFGYVFLVALAVLLLFELLADKLFFLRAAFFARVIGFAVGFSPWIAYNLQHGFSGLRPYGRSFAEHFMGDRAISEALTSIETFLAADLPGSFYMPSIAGISNAILSAVMYVVLLLLVLAAIIHHRASIARAAAALVRRRPGFDWHPTAVFAAYPIAYVAAYAVSDFRVETLHVQQFRYAMPVLPWLFLLAAVGFDALAGRKQYFQPAGWVLAGTFLLLSLAGNVDRCEFAGAPESWKHRGRTPAGLARVIAENYITDHAELGRIVDRITAGRPKQVQHDLLFTTGQTLKFYVRPGEESALTPRARERLPDYGRTLDFLHAAVAPAFVLYFERPVPDETIFRHPRDRDRFLAERERRLEESD